MQQKLEKWNAWLDAIRKDLRAAAIQRHIYLELSAIVTGSTRLPRESDLYWYLEVQHAQSLVMAVRRQVKSGTTSISMVRLLEDIRANAHLLTRQRLLDGLDPAFVSRFAKEADAVCDPSTGQLDPMIVVADLDELKAASTGIEEYADRIVAHLDKRQPRTWPKYEDLHAAIDLLEQILFRYMFVVDGSLGGSLLMGFDQQEWREPLRQAWLL